MPDANGKLTWEEQKELYTQSARRGPNQDDGSSFIDHILFPEERGLNQGRRVAYGGVQPQQNLRAASDKLKPQLLRDAQRGVASNPYNEEVANRSRHAQMALMNQMRAQQAGPSLAALQGQRAMGQLGQQSIGNAAMGGSGRAAMLQAGQAGAGVAGDTAQGRLAEIIRSQAALGGMAGGMRGNALNSAQQQQQLGLAAQRLADQSSRFNAGQGVTLAEAVRRGDLEAYKMFKRSISDATKEAIKNQDKAIETGGTILDIVF